MFMQPWDKLVDGSFQNGDDRGTGVGTDPSGNIYVAGLMSQGPTVGIDEDGWLGKFSPTGTTVWNGTYNNPADNSDVFRSVAANASFAYIAGYSYNGTTPARDIIVRRYTAAGSADTTVFVNGSGNLQDIGTDVVLDASGNVYVTGQINVSGQGNNGWVTKYTSTLGQTWNQTYNGASNLSDVFFGVAVDGSGNVYAVGWESTVSQGTNIVVRKYNSSGVAQWTQTFDQAGLDDFAYDVAVDSAGDIYVAGSVRLTSVNNDGWIRKYSTTGATLWTVTYTAGATAEARGIATCNGNVYVTGYYDVANQDQNVWMRRMTNAGVTTWDRSYNGSANLQDWGWGAACDPSNNIVFSGWTDLGTGGNPKIWMRKYYQ
jgi:uncharacterized delta-60 repeat protein